MSERHHRRGPQPGRGEGDGVVGAGDGQEPRPRTRADERISQIDTSPTRLVQEIEELRQKLAAAEQEVADNRAGWQRATADFMNYRRRTEQDRQANLGLANEALLAKLLVIADDFDRAVAHIPSELAGQGWVEGIVAIDRKLRQLLESEGVTPIEAQGRPFDPHEHEAVTQEETARVPEGTVTSELQRGYRIRDRVLRPAMVAVAKSPASGNDDVNRSNQED